MRSSASMTAEPRLSESATVELSSWVIATSASIVEGAGVEGFSMTGSVQDPPLVSATVRGSGELLPVPVLKEGRFRAEIGW